MSTIFPLSASVGQIFGGYQFNGTSWNIIGIDLTQNYATASALTSHESDTTNIHGITNSASLVYNNQLNSYLTVSSASATYLTQTSASSTYATKVELGGAGLNPFFLPGL